mmetsp:Transcript_26161/g.43789  ORF Transcript_26161/g.43789 Transcript_26161/m.43789 type:complete len:553 (-) Transcript_26161:175-1833(-)
MSNRASYSISPITKIYPPLKTGAMAHWGIGYASGHNYNFPVLFDYDKAYKHTVAAKQLAEQKGVSITELEKGLIDSLQLRYEENMLNPEEKPKEAAAQIARLQVDYASSMRAVYKKFGENPHVAAFFAEQLMNRKPWELWVPDQKTGDIPTFTLEARDVLARSLKDYPNHPGLCHLYIHCMELSPTPEVALDAADALAAVRVPGSGHLTHMATHIDMWVGNYERAVKVNAISVEQDKRYVEKTGHNDGFYAVYRAHNLHFQMWAACFDGQYEVALNCAKDMGEMLPEEIMNQFPGYLEWFCVHIPMVYIRFGKWNEILQEPFPKDPVTWPAMTAVLRYSRGIAFAALGKVEEAEKEQKLFHEALARTELHRKYGLNNLVYDTSEKKRGNLNVAEKMLEGEILYRKGEYDKAFQALKEAVTLDDSLIYDEPWGWSQPARHALGALLAEQKHYEEAISVFKEDLKRWPENLWALCGLLTCAKGNGDVKETEMLKTRLAKASSRATISVDAACFCANRLDGEVLLMKNKKTAPGEVAGCCRHDKSALEKAEKEEN